MKHLPTEMLYFLRIYNYIQFEIGLESAKAREKDIRAFIASCDFLKDYPTLSEDFSERKSIDHIITYIKRIEKTYDIIRQWKDKECEALFSEIGENDHLCSHYGPLAIKKDISESNAYMLLYDIEFADINLIFKGADLKEDITISNEVLWYELYRSAEGMVYEVFTEDFKTVKIVFKELKIEKIFPSALDISPLDISPWEHLVSMASLIYEKYEYDPSLLCEKELSLLQTLEFLSALRNWNIKKASSDAIDSFALLLEEYSLNKAKKLLDAILETKKDRRAERLHQKLLRELSNVYGEELWRRLYGEICVSQSQIPRRSEINSDEVYKRERKAVSDMLFSLGYSGEYPDFYKAGSKKGISVASSYGMDYFVGPQKNALYFIKAYERLTTDNEPVFDFLSGTVFPKKCDDTKKDVFSAMFFDSGRRFFKNTFNTYGDSSNTRTATIAAKRAEFKKLTKEERKNLGHFSFGYYFTTALILGSLFSLAFFAVFGAIIALILLAFGEIEVFFNVIPWGWLFIFSTVAFGGSMSFIQWRNDRK